MCRLQLYSMHTHDTLLHLAHALDSFPPLHMNATSKHVQFSLLAGLLAVFGLTVAFAGAQDTGTLPKSVLPFIRTEPNVVSEAGNPFSGAKFDIQSYMSHPCFQIVGSEAALCRDQYGITTPLQQYIQDGSLLGYLASRGLLVNNNVVNTMQQSTSSESTSASTQSFVPAADLTWQQQVENFERERAQRNMMLWAICQMKNSDYSDAAFCFQRNIRLTRRFSAPMDPSSIQ